jgi:hypothetical protein
VLATDGIVGGKIYSFATLAVNSAGTSGLSPLSYVAVAAVPPQPAAAPDVDRAKSGATSLHVTWQAIADDPAKSPAADITGYTLYMATPDSGDTFTAILDTQGSATKLTQYLVTSPAHTLVAGQSYRFKVVAHNRAGSGPASLIATFLVCGVPSGFAKPYKVATTTTPASSASITVGWAEPTSIGGCPIVGYAVHFAAGTAPLAETSPPVQGQPTLR